MTEKKTQAMTPKRFIRAKLSGKITAEAFLDAHRAFLDNHGFLTPILKAYDEKELLPTPTLEACKSALFTHVIESEIKTAKAKIEKAASVTKIIRKGEKIQKDQTEAKPSSAKYTVTIMVKDCDRNGVVVGMKVGEVEVVKTKEVLRDGEVKTVIEREMKPAVFDSKDYGAAERKADRCLYAMHDSVYAIIENNEGVKVVTNIQRADAIARVSKGKKGPVSKERGKSTKTLGFGVKAKNDRSTGPWNF